MKLKGFDEVMNRTLTKLSIGMPKKMNYAEGEMVTAIDKAVVKSAYLEKEGFLGNDVGDLKHHGGLDRAVCVYPDEHYAFWEEEFGSALPASPFGENLTVTNMLESDVCIGDIYQVGEAVIQVTQGRMPCVTINKQTKKQQLLKRMIDTGYTGYLCRVIESGVVTDDADIKLLKQGPGAVSVLQTHQVYYHDKENIDEIKRAVAVDVLADRWKSRLMDRLERLTESK
jgi:MOSC domain-containing protein YiiM